MATPRGGPLTGAPPTQKLAAAQVDEAGDAAQQRRLAAAARADDAERLAVAHLEIELAERGDGAVEKQLARVRGDDDGRSRLLGGHCATCLQ